MQLASLLDPTAVMDHPGTSAAGILSAHHPHQSAALAGTGGSQHGTTSPPGDRVPSVAGSQHTAGGPSGGGTDALPSDESVGYPSPDNGVGSASGGVGPSPHVHIRGVSFSGQGSSGCITDRTPGHGHSRGSFSTSTTSVTGPGNSTGRATEPSGSGGRDGGAAGGVVSASTSALFPDMQRVSSLYRAPSADCRYSCLAPVLPYLGNIIPASVACDLLDVYLTEPGSSLFRCASPYILTRIFRKRSLLHPTRPRPTTPALLATMLWCAAQTADIVLLHVPGSRSKITNALYELSTSLISERDPDRWRRIHGGLRVENDQSQNHYAAYIRNIHGGAAGGIGAHQPETTATNEPAGLVDDVLTLVLLSIAVSGGDFKSDCFKWWSKAIRLTLALGLHREDDRCSASVSPCANPLCSCRRHQDVHTLAGQEACEERRRVFWLVYCLDRHLALSFNNVLAIPDSYCQVYSPLPESVWEDLDAVSSTAAMPARVLGPPAVVSGTGFFEYFLPLMATLGDIIEVHHRRLHPRLGGLDDSGAVALIGERLAACEQSLDRMALEAEQLSSATTTTTAGGCGGTSPARGASFGAGSVASVTSLAGATVGNGEGGGGSSSDSTSPLRRRPQQQPHKARDRSRLQLVLAYSTHILHVLHVLLHGKWDAISMLDDDDDWITSPRFNDCATHAISASQAVSRILRHDPELTFMPYLFGIYLLHGSFILLLFADRMPQLGGPNHSVEQACETIVRAHEVCVVTLSTEFQKNFRKVLRSTLYSVRGSSPTEWEEHKARRRALSLYRWTRGAKGLAL
ncbi:transcriptional activator xlnR [Magnaporthiopsis poae ATCC 64411]|uniref:Transcriptional activator xlnR n=1 Tax=Magnaporthiopsis poae (strain ATCC 64411 / 73-15) TaxID=644358 RepID=A0A0C4DQB8_MAGP6|nr:transcriptional activator xlnR [Magnaporthiopsis poae ATCC 64411]